MQKSLVRKGLVLGIIVLFIGTSVVPSISSDESNGKKTTSEYKAGIFGFGSSSDHTNPIVFRNISGQLLTILDYDETQTLYQISHPSTPDDWEIIWDITQGTIDYNHPDGLYINGHQDEWYFALYPDNISVEDYTVITNLRHDDHHTSDAGIIFNYEDENNWYWGDLNQGFNPYFKLWKNEDGSRIEASPYYYIPMIEGVTYDLKIKVSNSGQEVRVYINEGLWNFTIFLSEVPPEFVALPAASW